MTARLAGNAGAMIAGPLLLWLAVIWATDLPFFMLPAPDRVFGALIRDIAIILPHAGFTIAEVFAGLAIGALLGCETALVMSFYRGARRWMMPVLVCGLALPVFAVAPILVLWFGYGMAPKIIMAALIIYFPVASAFFDGLRRTDPGWIDLAHVMNARPAKTLFHIRLPAALPALGSGLRIATALAPNAAVVGEWVGASHGLGFLMLHANARMQTDVMFAAALILAAFSILLYFSVDAMLRRATAWQSEDLPEDVR